MKAANLKSFPYAEQVLGYRLTSNGTSLSRGVETNAEVVEVIEVWSGTVQRVTHLAESDVSDLIEWDGKEAYFVRPALGTLMCETEQKLSMVAETAGRFVIPENSVLHLKHGLHHTMIRRVKGGRRVGLAPISLGESTFVAALTLCASMGALFALLVTYMPVAPTLEGQALDDRFAHIMLLKEKVKETKPKPKPRRMKNKRPESSKPSQDRPQVAKRDGGGNGKRFGSQKAKDLETVHSAGILDALNSGAVIGDMTIDAGLIQAMSGTPKGKMVGRTLGLGDRHGGLWRCTWSRWQSGNFRSSLRSKWLRTWHTLRPRGAKLFKGESHTSGDRGAFHSNWGIESSRGG